MVYFSSILVSGVAILSSIAQSTPVQPRKYEYSVKELHNPPRKWTRVGPAPSDAILNLNIGMKMAGWGELERHLYEVSDPSHARYGQHLTQDEVTQLSRPHGHALDSLHEWLASHGYTSEKLKYTPAKDWVKVSISVCDAEKLLKTKYSVFRHEDGTEVIRTPQYSLPTELHQHVASIQPTNSFLQATPQRVTFKPVLEDGQALSDMPKVSLKSTADSLQMNDRLADQPLDKVCDPESITPACLRQLYKTNNYVPKATDKNYVAFANYLNETAMLGDLKAFLTQYRPEAAGASINFTLINGGTNTQSNLTMAQLAKQQNAEGNLDGQTLVSMVYPMRVKAYNTGGSPPFKPDAFTRTNSNEPYLEWVQYMLSTEKDLPGVVSNSYGDNEQTVPADYAERVCQGFAQLGARGVTILFASGDNGVGNDGACQSNDGKNSNMFLPAFPASCPYVTVVGGTKNVGPEVAAFDPKNNFASGGGFSNYFARPSYQSAVVDAYVKSLGATYQGMYNTSGRAYPDIAAQAQSYSVVWNGRNIILDGTSASTPAVAGIIALLNDYLISNGKKQLGFMNPWLYQVGYQGFNDILSGGSKGCDGAGFQAAKGWDPVTGFGTPDFPKLQQLAMQATGAPASPPAVPGPSAVPGPPAVPAPPAAPGAPPPASPGVPGIDTPFPKGKGPLGFISKERVKM
ncbi:tripeptidyl-peptidase 1 precursor [Microthyrium microscopicum]|uniref:tripeptidyl-peptidase II n=1 Tax=Microthyrium microscopicum TaxID=703497 RepID=A0A6A6UH56_9PEZI|nr:tripeptidyl-peptidase 1 precursor [Microthyrium microscopicum]